MEISSPAFEDGEMMPKIFTCDGKSINPHLIISATPENAQSLVLIMDDTDAPGGQFTHWVVWNIPPDTKDIPEGGFVEGSVEGINSAGRQGYTGPCPPSGAHRYFFNLYALDILLSLSADSERNELEAEMADHIISEARLMAKYQR